VFSNVLLTLPPHTSHFYIHIKRTRFLEEGFPYRTDLSCVQDVACSGGKKLWPNDSLMELVNFSSAFPNHFPSASTICEREKRFFRLCDDLFMEVFGFGGFEGW
jgi:hypothetical protein